MLRPNDRVLIIMFGAIGDVVRALSIPTRIKRVHPEVHITWAIEPASFELVREHPAVDEVLLFNRPKGFSAFVGFLAELRTRQFSIVLDMQRHLKSGVTSRAARAPLRVGFHRQNSREGNWLFNNRSIPSFPHYSSKLEQFESFGDFLNVPRLDPIDFGLQPSDAARAELERRMQENFVPARVQGFPPRAKRVAVLLGASWKTRLWPALHYEQTIRHLWNSRGMVPVFVGAPSDRELCQKICAQLAGDVPVIDMVAKTAVSELAPVLAEVAYCFGSESGPMHIAAAVATPVISIWGPTPHARSSAYKNEQYVLRSPIGCAPCHRGTCPGLETLCMRDVPPEAVLALVEQIEQRSQHG